MDLIPPSYPVGAAAQSRTELMKAEAVVELCDEGSHYFLKLPDHPKKDGKPRCPYCMAINLEKREARDREDMGYHGHRG